MEFKEFPKMARFSREIIITEKIDGTNAQVFITDSALDDLDDSLIVAANVILDGRAYNLRAGSRNKWIVPGKQDNAGFAGWAHKNAGELVKLGEGQHFGEWWGSGIQRGYGMKEKVFSLFNVDRWSNDEVRPKCCRVVPELWRGILEVDSPERCINYLKHFGSQAAPDFMDPEGIIIWHTAANIGFKKTIKNDESPKSLVK